MTDHAQLREWDAAYVLGMLSPDERRLFEEHLAECEICRAAVAEVAGMPALLSLLTEGEAVALETEGQAAVQPPQDGGSVQRLARAVRGRRTRARRRSAVIAVGVAASIALGGVAAGVLLQPSPASAPQASAPPATAMALAMAQVEPGWLDADLVVTEKGWGTRFDWDCSYRDRSRYQDTPDGTTYDLVVTDAAGAETTVASWTARGDSAGNLSASTSIPTTEIRSVDIRVAGTENPLVRTDL